MKSIFKIEIYDALTKEKYNLSEIEDIKPSNENILLIINDILHDMVDEGDYLKIVLKKDWDKKDLGKAINFLYKHRKHWIK